MLADLVHVVTEDGLRLDGALYERDSKSSGTLAVDAVLCLHGTGSNFYSSNLMASLVAQLRRQNADVLVVNTRGHDGISTTSAPLGRRLQGAAYEIVDACRHDVAAWLGLLRDRGRQRIGILGHSLGAVKAIYALAHRAEPDVAWLAGVSPPRLSHTAFRDGPRGGDFLADFVRAGELVRAGRGETLIEIRFPLPYAISAAGFLDKYGPDERYNILGLVDRLPCPLLVTYGTGELDQVAFAGMPEALGKRTAGRAAVSVAIVAGADHFYSGCYDQLWSQLERGLRRLLVSGLPGGYN